MLKQEPLMSETLTLGRSQPRCKTSSKDTLHPSVSCESVKKERVTRWTLWILFILASDPDYLHFQFLNEVSKQGSHL